MARRVYLRSLDKRKYRKELFLDGWNSFDVYRINAKYTSDYFYQIGIICCFVFLIATYQYSIIWIYKKLDLIFAWNY